jgi:hypothetical protein
MVAYKILIRTFCKDLENAAIKYVESKEFKNSPYNNYTAFELLEAINTELHEEKRAALLCLLNYKLERKFFMSHDERKHFQHFKAGL